MLEVCQIMTPQPPTRVVAAPAVSAPAAPAVALPAALVNLTPDQVATLLSLLAQVQAPGHE
jgi:hypothetical protein